MKKLFYILDSLMAISAFVSIICYSIFAKTFLLTMFTVLVVILSCLHVLYVLNYRDKKNGISSILIVLGIVLAFIANAFIVKNNMAFLLLLCFSEIAYILAIIFNAKFSQSDIFYMVAIAIPVILFVNLSPIFGYANVGTRLLVTLLVLLMSCLFGLSVSHLINNKSAFNTSFTVISFLNLLYGLGLVVLKQSNVTHRVTPIINIWFYVLLMLFSLTILLINKDHKKYANNTKRNIVYSINIMIVAMLIGYTIASNFIAFNFVSAKISKEQFLSKVNNLNIPLVEIYTQNNEQPKNKTDYVNCSFEISNCESDEYNFSVTMTAKYDDEGCVGIRLRGNSTMKARKQPYRIKFDKKQSLFGLKANKSWVLLADYYDQSYIRNYAAFTLADNFDNLDFTPTPHHVALVINDEFKGLYLLCEQMDEKKGRANVDEDFDVNIDKEFPFLVEMDIYAFREGVTGVDNFYVESVDNHVEIKYPEADERYATATSDIVYDYIYEYLNAVFTIVKTNEKVEVSFRDNSVGLEDLVDIDSAVDYYLVNEIMLNIDSAYKSIYFHKTKDGKMEFGPVWDFDFSMTTELVAPYEKSYIEGTENLWIAKNSAIFNNLLKNEVFYNKVSARFEEKKDAILQTSTKLKDYKDTINSVAVLDSQMWHGMTGEFQFDMQYDYVRLFLIDRYTYLNSVFAKSHSEFINLI